MGEILIRNHAKFKQNIIVQILHQKLRGFWPNYMDNRVSSCSGLPNHAKNWEIV